MLTPTTDRQYLAPADAADELGFRTTEPVYALIASGELAAIDVGGGQRRKPRWIISREALDRFLASRSTRPAAPATPTRPRRRRNEHVIQFYT